jgi:hypothetical protein
MQEDKFQNNKGMVNSNLNIPIMMHFILKIIIFCKRN